MPDYTSISNDTARIRPSAMPMILRDDFLSKYKQLGGETGFLGQPETEIQLCPDEKGLYQHFLGGSLYWHDGKIVEIHGAIRDKWAELGWERSFLGYPISDETDFTEDGKVSVFEHGEIYWWPDTGAIELNDVVVHYTGMVCFGETDNDQLSPSDEPYVIMGVIDPGRPEPYTLDPIKYEGVDARESRPDLIEVYWGKPRGLTISVLLMEHDYGDPDVYKSAMQSAIGTAFAGITALIAIIPIVGPVIAGIAGPIFAAVTPTVGAELNRLLDTGDDKIGEATVALTPKQMVVLAARTVNSKENGVSYKMATPLLSAFGASYKVYFGIVPT